MQFKTTFLGISQSDIHNAASSRAEDGWRYVQMLAVNTEDGIDIIYSFMKDGNLENLKVSSVEKGSHVPSITDLYLEAFVCENEIHDLFGISFDGLAIDFGGNFYRVKEEYPMTVISPEVAAQRARARKIAAAKAAKAAGKSAGKAAQRAGEASAKSAEGAAAPKESE